MSDSVQHHRRQPTRLSHPWDSPGKNSEVGCHFLLQCVKVKSLSHVRLSATPWTACSLPGSSIHGIFQARVLEWGAIAFSEDPVTLELFYVKIIVLTKKQSRHEYCENRKFINLIKLYTIMGGAREVKPQKGNSEDH